MATVAINNATNAGLLAVRMLGVADNRLLSRLLFLHVPEIFRKIIRCDIDHTVQGESVSRGAEGNCVEERCEIRKRWVGGLRTGAVADNFVEVMIMILLPVEADED